MAMDRGAGRVLAVVDMTDPFVFCKVHNRINYS